MIELQKWNRSDLIAELLDFAKTQSQELTPHTAHASPIHFIGDARLTAAPPTLAPPPIPPLKVHKPSADLFRRAKDGHAMTGVVRLAHNSHLELGGRFVRSVNEDIGWDDDEITDAWDNPGTRIYKDETQYAHDHTTFAGHAHLVTRINQKSKWKSLSQQNRGFLGFTVMKGTPIRFSFTSAGCNMPTTTIFTQGPKSTLVATERGVNSCPPNWALAIVQTFILL